MKVIQGPSVIMTEEEENVLKEQSFVIVRLPSGLTEYTRHILKEKTLNFLKKVFHPFFI